MKSGSACQRRGIQRNLNMKRSQIILWEYSYILTDTIFFQLQKCDSEMIYQIYLDLTLFDAYLTFKWNPFLVLSVVGLSNDHFSNDKTVENAQL